MPRVPWVLTDLSTGSPVELSMDINPNTWREPGYNANISTSVTTAPNGQNIFFQGRKSPSEGSFQGSIRTSVQYDDLREWFTKPYPIQLTDDLGNVWTILVKSFELDRANKTNTQYSYKYTVNFIWIE